MNQSPMKDLALKKAKLFPLQHAPMDHFKVTEECHLYTLMGKMNNEHMYSSGCVFVDHATGNVHTEHFINFTTSETIPAKKYYEKQMVDINVVVQSRQWNHCCSSFH